MSNSIIELKNICLSTQGTTVIDNISYSFEKEKATALIGPSGCGKSTLLKLAAGLILPTSGNVLYNGQDVFLMNRTQTLEYRRKSSFVFQDSALWANQSIRQILELPLKIHFPKMKLQERTEIIKRTLSSVGYKKQLDIRPAALSMGEQKLVAFTRAMLYEPDLLYLDEWTESLDEIASKRLVRIVKQKKKENKTVIFVSHDLNVIKTLADTVCIISEGKLSTVIPIEEVTTDESLEALIEKGIAK